MDAARPRAFRRDETGAVAIVAVLMLGAVFAIAALAVDVSRFYLVKRQQQMVTDLAAVAAAANLGNAQAAALANLAANGFPASALVSIELGTYTADPTVPASQRFVSGSAAGNNAARVTLRSAAATFLGRALGPVGAAAAVISTRSVAAISNTADFALGSTLASFDGGLANAILGGLTGSQISLSVLDYQNLASANVDLFGLARALAVRMGAGNVTLSTLASRPVHLSDLVSAAADAGSAGGMPSASVAALRSLAAAVAASGPSVTLGTLVDYSVYGNLLVGASPPVAAPLPVLPFVSAAARLSAVGAGPIQASLGATVPGILAATARIVIGAPPVGGTYAGIGPNGTTLHTAQVRTLLNVQLGGLGAVTGLNLPLYVEVAPAKSRIASLACSGGSPADPPVTLGVETGVVTGWIGSVSNTSLADMSAEPTPGPAALANLGLLVISGRAEATIANNTETLVPFSLSDIAAHRARTVATTDYTSSLLGNLFGSLQLSATFLGITAAVPPGTSATIGQILQNTLQPVDTELSNTLAMLGLTVGDATSWVGGVRCGGGSLVN